MFDVFSSDKLATYCVAEKGKIKVDIIKDWFRAQL